METGAKRLWNTSAGAENPDRKSEKQIYVSSASACGRGQPSHTLAAMGRDPLAIDTAIRVSFCADNTPEDVDAFLERFEDGMKHLQRIKK